MAYANKRCKAFLEADPRLGTKITKHGYQPDHISDRIDAACTVHCKKPKGGWKVYFLTISISIFVSFL